MSNKKFDVVLCSCLVLKYQGLDFNHYALTDILTKKSVKMISEEYDDYNSDDIVDAVLNTALPKNNVPGILLFVGYMYENDDAVMLEISPTPPVMTSIVGTAFSCYIDGSDDERVYRDSNTDKKIIFEDMDSIPDLKNNVNVFLSDEEYNSYNRLSENRIIIMTADVDFKDDGIYIKAGDMRRFGDKQDVYVDLVYDIKEKVEKDVSKLGDMNNE